MNTKQTLGLCTVLLFALFAVVSQARPQKAVLNARQLGLDELSVDEYLKDDDSAGDEGDYVEDDEDYVEDDGEYVEDEEAAEDEEEEDIFEEAEDEVDEEVEDETEDEEIFEDEEEVDEETEEATEDEEEEEVEEATEDEEEEVEEEEVEEEEVEEEEEEEVDEETEDEEEEVFEEEEETEEIEEEEEVEEETEDEEEEVFEEEEEETEEIEEEEEEEEEEESFFEETEEVEEETGLEEEEEETVEEEEAPVEEADEEPFFEEEEAPAFQPDEAEDAERPAAVDERLKSLSEIELLEKLRREMFLRHGVDSFKQGRRALENGSWHQAIDKFTEALDFLQDREDTHEMRLLADENIADAYYRMSLQQTDDKAYEDAKKSLREARGHIDSTSPLYKKIEQQLKTIREYEENPPVEPPPPHVPRPVQPGYRKIKQDISERLSTAREYYATGEYREARMHVERILRDHPWHPASLDLLRKIRIAEHRYAADEQLATREGMIRDVTIAWGNRNYGQDFEDIGAAVAPVDPKEADNRINGAMDEVRMREKMKSIMLESIEYRQANIVDVINELGDLSREFDQSDVPPEERGINFMLNIGGDAAASSDSAPAADEDWWASDSGSSGGSDGSYAGIPPVSVKARFISLLDALDMIMEMSQLKYRIKGNIVMIMRKNAAIDELQHRMYSVLPSITEVQLSLGETRADSGSDNWSINPGDRSATTDWKSFFGDLGVAWPDGSSVKYVPAIGKLVVRNTPDNLATLEQVLGALNVTPFQVEIEVRFVEVSQLDLNSLGLEWILDDDYELVENKRDASLPYASRRRGVIKAGNINSGFNYLSNNSRLGVNSGNPIADGILTFKSILTNPEFSVVLHALSNRSNTDLLSAPKVTARTGTTATIKTVTEFIYPTEYKVEYPESDSSTTIRLSDGSVGSLALPAVEPQEFKTREVGIVLQVTPTVSSDGTRISLDLQPSVVSEPSWKDYGYTYPVNPNTGEGFHLTMEQPFFPVRSLATSVDIYNGATVVMGGMIREERFTEENKIPILGDIPLIGYLFRNKYEQTDKRNLMIFVTARLVDPAGRGIVGGATDLVTGVSSDGK